MKTKDENLLKEAIQIMIDNGSIKYAEQKAQNLMRKAWDDVEVFLPEGEGKKNLEALSTFLIDRSL